MGNENDVENSLKDEVKELKDELNELKQFIKQMSGAEPGQERKEGTGEEEEKLEESEAVPVNAVDMIAEEIKASIESKIEEKDRENTEVKDTLKNNAEKKQKVLKE